MNNFTWDPKLSVSDIFSFIALLISAGALFITIKIGREGSRNTVIQKRNEAEKLCNEALNLMNGNQPGTEALYIDFTKPALDEERSYFERARQKLEEAVNLSPNFYLCHQYWGLYTLKMDGLDIFERAEKAIPYYKEAVRLWKIDTSPRVQSDGWPFHDLAVAFKHHGDQEEAEKYYQEALRINSDTEPDFYADFAQFLLSKVPLSEEDLKKHNEFYEIARRIASAGHRKSNRPDLLN